MGNENNQFFDIYYTIFKKINIILGLWPGSRTYLHYSAYVLTFIMLILHTAGQVIISIYYFIPEEKNFSSNQT